MSITVQAGDIEKGKWSYSGWLGSSVMSRTSTSKHLLKGESYDLKNGVESIEKIDEQNAKRLAGTALWGAAGAILLGPLGAIGGMMIGGNGKSIAFVCILKDGQKFMATTDSKTWAKIQSARF